MYWATWSVFSICITEYMSKIATDYLSSKSFWGTWLDIILLATWSKDFYFPLKHLTKHQGWPNGSSRQSQKTWRLLTRISPPHWGSVFFKQAGHLSSAVTFIVTSGEPCNTERCQAGSCLGPFPWSLCLECSCQFLHLPQMELRCHFLSEAISDCPI